MAYFSQTLPDLALEWFVVWDIVKWHNQDDMANKFVQQFQYNIDLVLDEKFLTNMKMKNTESFKEYPIKWHEQVDRVKTPMKENKIVGVFLCTQNKTYFQHFFLTMDKSFIAVIKIREIIENRIKIDRIVRVAALKETTHAIQNGSKNFGIKKMMQQ